MADPTTTMALAGFASAGLAVTSAAALRAWGGWLEVKRLELTRGRRSPVRAASTELQRLRERVRRLEAIADGADL